MEGRDEMVESYFDFKYVVYAYADVVYAYGDWDAIVWVHRSYIHFLTISMSIHISCLARTGLH